MESVFNQTYPNWECILVDDGSTDNTEEISLKWCKTDTRYKYIKKKNGGPGSARNTGLAAAKGEYIQFLDGDDLLNHFKLERQINYFNQKTDIVICDYFPFDQRTGAFLRNRYLTPFPNPDSYKDEIILLWETRLSIPIHCILFKSSLLTHEYPLYFDESLPNHMDWVFWAQLFSLSNGIYNLEEALASYRIHNESICSDEEKMKKGFIMACEINISFFKQTNNKKALKQCQEKYLELTGNKKIKAKNIIKLFTPPIFIMFLKKLLTATKSSTK